MNTQNMQLMSRVNDSDTMGVLSLINENYPRTVFIVILFKVINFKGKVVEATRRWILADIYFLFLSHTRIHTHRTCIHIHVPTQRDWWTKGLTSDGYNN